MLIEQIEQQKKLIHKLENSKSMKPEEREELMKLIKTLQESIETIKKGVDISAAHHQQPRTKVPPYIPPQPQQPLPPTSPAQGQPTNPKEVGLVQNNPNSLEFILTFRFLTHLAGSWHSGCGVRFVQYGIGGRRHCGLATKGGRIAVSGLLNWCSFRKSWRISWSPAESRKFQTNQGRVSSNLQ